eukprot:TRINITY_DN1493_c0_g1_i1.p2 TRINITY_DN1493_c0_g1~~TRINITY_DN1493_c0_g1_i1.p2  ORF type:complete len:202 (+),score=30.07 TRINITY_DN1493_c0_g1_i1:65-670(+)
MGSQMSKQMLIMNAGVSARGSLKKANDAAEEQKHGTMDEKEAATTAYKTKGKTVRAPEVGSNERRRRKRNGPQLSGGSAQRCEVPSLSGPRPPGSIIPTHGRSGAGKHLRQSKIRHLHEGRNDNKGRRPCTENAIHSKGTHEEHPTTNKRSSKHLHVGAGELLRRRTSGMVSEKTVSRQTSSVFGNIPQRRNDRSFCSGSE